MMFKKLKINLKLMSLVYICSLLSNPSFGSNVENDIDHLRKCAQQWDSHPFGTINEKTKYRTFDVKVRVLGIGGENEDLKVTKEPELILIKPSVSVLSSTTYKFLNPQGYYCIAGKVAVLSKTVIEVSCKTHIASSQEVEVMGTNKGEEKQGVTVLSKSLVKRLNCQE